jgi:SAM-dependent methyltransferase
VEKRSRPRFIVVLIKAYRLLAYRGPKYLFFKILDQIRRRLPRRGSDQSVTAEHWDQQWRDFDFTNPRRNWWDSPRVVQHIYSKIDAKLGGDLGEACACLLRKRAPGRRFERAISIGCGSGFKEMKLLEAGLVGSFDLFEVSQAAIDVGQAEAQKRGLSERVRFHCQNLFAGEIPTAYYDLVHWNNSLHHMSDVDLALAASKQMLRAGGLLYVEDYVGASRFQWNEENLKLVNNLYSLLPSEMKRDPANPGFSLPRKILRPLAEDVIFEDPSEAVDSGRILASLSKHFPRHELLSLGGSVYHPLLAQTIANFDESKAEHRKLLDFILAADDAAEVLSVPPHYAIAVSEKDA